MSAEEIKKIIAESGLTVTALGVDEIAAPSFVCDNLSYVLGGADSRDCESWCDIASCYSCPN